jgi:5-hydroxyisourate hydrolase-like protein (transthyretin family)
MRRYEAVCLGLVFVFIIGSFAAYAAMANSDTEQDNKGLIEILIQDADTKKPIEGASVYIRNEDTMQFFGAITNKDGLAKISAAAGKYMTNSAYKAGFQNWVQNITLTVEKGKTSQLEIQLTGPTNIKGIVKDKAGKPLDGVKLQISPAFASVQTVSDANGMFALQLDSQNQMIYGGESIFLIARDQKKNLAESVEIEKGTKSLNITLKPAVVITGRVINTAGKGIAGASVSVQILVSNTYTSIEAAKTDKEGKFEVKALPTECNYYISISAEDYGTASVAVEGSEVENNRYDAGLIKLAEANLSISGIVVDINETPIAEATIYTNPTNGQPSMTVTSGKDGKFTTNKLCAGTVQLEVIGNEYYNRRIEVEAGATDVRIVLRKRTPYRSIVSQPVSLVGKNLPDLNEVGIELTNADANDKMILVCFFDMQQRPSRYITNELAKQAENLKQKSVIVAIVQASKVEQNTLNDWIKKTNLPFPAGTISGDEEKMRSNWGVRSLPWLILTDKEHIIKAEGFALNELDEKVKEIDR